jgi:Acyl-CoA dehydrogenases
MGQRQTDSGTSHFEQVRIHENELLLNPGPLSTPYSSLRPLIAQLIFVHMFLGVAEGAFEVAKQTVQTQKAWSKSLVEEAVNDPLPRSILPIFMCSWKVYVCWLIKRFKPYKRLGSGQ